MGQLLNPVRFQLSIFDHSRQSFEYIAGKLLKNLLATPLYEFDSTHLKSFENLLVTVRTNIENCLTDV